MQPASNFRFPAARPRWAILLALVTGMLSAGCFNQPNNPSFPVKLSTARDDLKRMEERPHSLHRPLVVVGGIFDPGIVSSWDGWEFAKLTGDTRVISVSLGDCFTFKDCRRKIVGAVNEAYPNHPRNQTVEVDVVGCSLGGVAARHAASPCEPGPRLDIVRLFTISSPNRGAVAANYFPVIEPLQADLKPGSEFMKRLNRTAMSYPIYCYVCLGDTVIGEANAAPPGERAWWLPDAPLTTPHTGAFFDPRILADIARRLRDEPALTHCPPTTLPAQ
ncbi:MAG TPA: hypothetical protein VK797_08710 [Tepidisphaeraceae bacterium]|nr:hypothetical protein [Tepidisphaeraceae bacterium]